MSEALKRSDPGDVTTMLEELRSCVATACRATDAMGTPLDEETTRVITAAQAAVQRVGRLAAARATAARAVVALFRADVRQGSVVDA